MVLGLYYWLRFEYMPLDIDFILKIEVELVRVSSLVIIVYTYTSTLVKIISKIKSLSR